MSAAEFIWHTDTRPSLLIQGDIERGDLIKFKNELDRFSLVPSVINLNSNGGSLLEAIEIGKLIRHLRLDTSAPTKFGDDSTICWREWSRIEVRTSGACTCASSCALIWMGGVNRTGDTIVIHRPYFDKEISKSLSLEDYSIEYQSVKDAIGHYLDELGLDCRLDVTHYTEYTMKSFNEELNKCGIEVTNYHIQWGEIYARCANITNT